MTAPATIDPDDYSGDLFSALSELVAKEGQRRGEALGEQGAKDAMLGSPDWQINIADRVIAQLAATGEEFSGNQVRPLVGPLHQPRMLGHRFKAAAKAGIIRPVGWTRSTDPVAHAAAMRTWIGTTTGGAA